MLYIIFFFFNDTATTEIYTLSLHYALPISYLEALDRGLRQAVARAGADLAIFLAGADPFAGDRLGRLALSKAGLAERDRVILDRKSTRLKSSHANISYAVFCLTKKKNIQAN